jgi:UDP-N-acetylmuramoyl-tripeptide--D-alanyl-D-alanine ligase
VAIIPDNLNTSLGIANYIIADKIPANTQWLIVEMGAYTQGDIAESVGVVAPDLAVITVLGDQHLERFGSKANLIHGKSELFTTASKTRCYVAQTSLKQISEQAISTDRLIPVVVPPGEKSTAYLVTQLARDLGVGQESIDTSLATFEPPDRRNNILVRSGVTIIDNSYNISPMVAEAMIKEAAETAQSQGKKLVIMTGGIGEQGHEARSANEQLAHLINQYADRALLNPTVYADYLVPQVTIPFKVIHNRRAVTDEPHMWLDGKTELLLWLTGHGDLAYV